MYGLVGRMLGKYRIEARLGSGGMATVYRAFQTGTERNVAIKVLRGDRLHEADFVQRFKLEATAVARLRHDNIVQVFDFDFDNDLYYMVMELIDGPTLEAKLVNHENQPAETPFLDGNPTPVLKRITRENRRWLRIVLDDAFNEGELRSLCFDMEIDYDDLGGKGQADNARELVDYCLRHGQLEGSRGLIAQVQSARPHLDWAGFWELESEPDNETNETIDFGISSVFSWQEIFDLFDDLADAIDYAHTQNIIHRDLKPGNIMFTDRGKVVLTDFGIAQIVGGDKQTDTDGLIGTYNYMAPEQLRGQSATPFSDIYALGVVLYEICTGKTPYDSRDLYQFFQQVGTPFPLPSSLNSDIPDGIDIVVSRALANEPRDRFSTAQEMAQALRQAVLGDELVEKLTQRPFLAPRDEPHFVGRDREISELETQLLEPENGRVICLTGMGGIGKTTLALRLAHRLRNHFPDGVLWADMKNSSLLSISDNWARAYSRDYSALPDVADRAAAIRNFLKDKKVLIILDDVWDAEKARKLLPNSQDCVVLVTTRDMYVAARLKVEPSIVPVLEPEQSYRLFLEVVGSERMAEDSELVGEACDLLGHLPLAISIAASRMRVHIFWKMTDLIERLRDETYRLQALELRDFTVQAVFALSWEMLNERVQRTFALLGVFGGRSFTTAAIAEIGAIQHFSARDHLDELESLSLVTSLEGQRRYRQHPLLADYAREILGEETAVYAGTARYYQNYTVTHRKNFTALEQEMNNIQAGIHIARQNKLWQIILDYVEALTEYWLAQGHYDDARWGYETAVVAAGNLQYDPALAENLLNWGRVCIEQNDYDEGALCLQRSIKIYTSYHDKAGVARAQYYLGRIALEQARYSDSLSLLEKSRLARIKINDEIGVAKTLFQEARVHYFTSDYDKSVKIAQNVLFIQEGLGDEQNSILTLNLLASIYYVQEQYRSAEDCCFKTIPLCEKFQSYRHLADVYSVLASIYRRQKQFDKAQVYAEKSLNLLGDSGIRMSQAAVLFELSMIHEGKSEYELALALGHESLNLSQEANYLVLKSYILIHLGDVYQEIKQPNLAQQFWQEALDLGEMLQNKITIDTVTERLGN